MKRLALSLALAFALPLGAHAAPYTRIDPERSQLGFGYTQMGVAMEGRFKRFEGQLRFDPDRPAEASATLDVALASIDTGTAEADEEVAGKAWFDSQAFPQARFVAHSMQARGEGRYEVLGTLRIKGRSQALTVPVRFRPDGEGGVFEGSFRFRRGDFAIGEGSWSAFDIVANDIAVRFSLYVLP